VEDREIELRAIRTQIKDVQSRISEARQDVDLYLTELQQNEMAIAAVSGLLETLQNDVSRQLELLEQLRQESDAQTRLLNTERELLAQQVRAAYKTGRHDSLKLLLNQEDPGLVGRMMAFHDYYNKARTTRITEVNITLQNLQRVKAQIDAETLKLESLREEQIVRLAELGEYRDSRTSVIRKLEEYIYSQDRELQDLQKDEQELAGLLNNLEQEQSVVEMYEELPPFDSLKGKLNWPVAGNMITRFGSIKRDGKLRWNGVRIAAKTGTDVMAISPGKVIFADWFRNLGLLIIIDHGAGYMSLYGHNERLMKKPGDYVAAGEPIAKVGDTGGQTESAVYFEIRQQGEPINPGLWCRG
jgi:septal ring factor EnvC (AmiA/AmiB activator)